MAQDLLASDGEVAATSGGWHWVLLAVIALRLAFWATVIAGIVWLV